jgi:hypothetical protein
MKQNWLLLGSGLLLLAAPAAQAQSGNGFDYSINVSNTKTIAVTEYIGTNPTFATGPSSSIRTPPVANTRMAAVLAMASPAIVVGSYYTSSDGLKAYVATPIPQLTPSQSAVNLQLSWPHNPFVNWVLQQNPDLTTTNWTAAPTNAISNDGTNNFINITPPAGNLFFRLSQQ